MGHWGSSERNFWNDLKLVHSSGEWNFLLQSVMKYNRGKKLCENYCLMELFGKNSIGPWLFWDFKDINFRNNPSFGKSVNFKACEHFWNPDNNGKNEESIIWWLIFRGISGLPVSRRKGPRGGRVGCGHRGGLQTGLDSSDQPADLNTINISLLVKSSSLLSPCRYLQRELNSESQAGTNLGQASTVYQVLFLPRAKSASNNSQEGQNMSGGLKRD